LGALPVNNALGFFGCRRSIKIDIEIKKGVVLRSRQIAGTHIFQAHARKVEQQPITKHPRGEQT
jgi:hypothetical protein